MTTLAMASGWLRDARSVAVLTGAGISAESGVPVFRGPGGLWKSFRPEDLATPEAFQERPAFVWEWYLWRRARIAEAEPNPGHRALARWAAAWPGVTLLTQNVDGLHARAGSVDPVELHGNLWRVRCFAGCAGTATDRETEAPRAQLRCGCGAWLRPDVVWFGEALDPGVLDRATAAVEQADAVIVIGTLGLVYPVAALPALARRRQARIIEVNLDDTPLTPLADAALRGPSGTILPELLGER